MDKENTTTENRSEGSVQEEKTNGDNNVDVDMDKFYTKAQDYWEGVKPTVDGMLGGYARISPTDINGSKAFLRPFIRGDKSSTGKSLALDCGSGIGRITKRLLLPMFDNVHMVEQNQQFLDQTPKFLGEEACRVQCFCSGLQNFVPETGRYDVIWSQWVLGHLTDDDLITFFKHCKEGLAPNGVMCVKENVKEGSERDYDEQDSSWTRTREDLEKLILQSGFKIVKKQRQRGFPKALYDVYMFALQ